MYGQPGAYKQPMPYGAPPGAAGPAPGAYQPPQAAYGAPAGAPGYAQPGYQPQGAPQGYQPGQAPYGAPQPGAAGPAPGAYQPPQANPYAPSPQAPYGQQPQSPYAPAQPYGAPAQGAPGAYHPPQPYGAPQPGYQPPQAGPAGASPYGQPPHAVGSPAQVGYQAHGAPYQTQPPALPPHPQPGYPGGPAPMGAPMGSPMPGMAPSPYGMQSTTTTMAPAPAAMMGGGAVVGAPGMPGAALGVLPGPATVKTTVVTYGPGTIFQCPSRWTLKQAWGWSDMYVKDEWGNDVFYANANNYSFSQQLNFTDLRTGMQIAYIKEKLKVGMPKFVVWVGGTKMGVIHQKFTLLNPKFHVKSKYGHDMVIHGDWLTRAFQFTKHNRCVANVVKEGFAMTDTYSVSIQPGEDVIFILACCIIVDKCVTGS